MTTEELEKIALKLASQCGMPDNMMVPDYGWVIRDGKVTEQGIEWYKDTQEQLGELLDECEVKELTFDGWETSIKFNREKNMKPSDFIKSVELRENQDTDAISARLQNKNTVRLLHAMIGMTTETSELQDMVKKHLIYGKELDMTNLVEELGDIMWYVGLACSAANVSLEEVMAVNNAKLAKRYGDVFSEQAALNRDLDAERKILEGKE